MRTGRRFRRAGSSLAMLAEADIPGQRRGILCRERGTPGRSEAPPMGIMTRSRFCWTWGVLGFGLTSGLAFALVMAWQRQGRLLRWLLISLPVCGACGYLWGFAMWSWQRGRTADGDGQRERTAERQRPDAD